MSERVAEADSDIPARQNHWQRIRVHPSGADGVLGHEDAEGAPANERRARRVRAGHDNHRPLPGAVQPLPRQLPLFQLLAEAIAQISRLKKEPESQQPVIVVKQENQQPVVEKQEEPPLPVVVPICEKIDGYEKQIAVLEATIRELQAREATERLQEKAATQAQQEKAATQTSQEKATVVEDESIKSRKQSQWSQ